MSALKAGRHEDIAASMAAAIESAMDDEWQHAYGEALPELGRDDRLILFKAIARGVLGYLAAHQSDIGTTPADVTGGGTHSHTLKFEVTDP